MPDEVFPRRNLGEGEHWGRMLESRFERVETRADNLSEMVGGSNRNTIGTLGELQRRAQQLAQGLGDVPIAKQASTYNSNFTVPQAWTIRAEAVLIVPPRKTRLDLTARGSVNIDWVASSGSPSFIWPFDPSLVSSEWGPRFGLPYHNGIDFAGGAASDGNPIPCSANGTVTVSGFHSEFGNYVIVNHGGGLSTLYAHMKFSPAVGVGNIVTQGQTLGYVGNTGYSFGSHLHWETRVGSARINPREFMATYGGGTSVPFDFDCRLNLGGVNVNNFKSSREPITGDNRFYIAGGRSFIVSPGTAVSAQIHLTTTNGLENPAYPATFAALTAFGIFS